MSEPSFHPPEPTLSQSEQVARNNADQELCALLDRAIRRGLCDWVGVTYSRDHGLRVIFHRLDGPIAPPEDSITKAIAAAERRASQQPTLPQRKRKHDPSWPERWPSAG